MEAAKRLKRISPNYFTVIGKNIIEQRSLGRDVIRLDIGSPDLPPPPEVLKVLLKTGKQADVHGYQPHKGSIDLRNAWATFYQENFGVNIDPDRELIPLLGSKEGIFHLTQALVNPGDVVLVPDPGYLTYTQATLFAGGIPYAMPLQQENGFLPRFTEIPEMVLKKVKIMWLNYPNNPTGAVADSKLFEDAINLARNYDFLVCHDAAYSLITFNGKAAPSILQIEGAADFVVEFNSLSKAYNMAGWRVGAAIGNPEALAALFKVKANADSGHFMPVLEAAKTALLMDGEWVKNRNSVYKERSTGVVQRLQAMGLRVFEPKGSIYVWSQIPEDWKRSTNFAKNLLIETGVSVTPGKVFGDYGDSFFRISLTTEKKRIEIAMDRIKEWLK